MKKNLMNNPPNIGDCDAPGMGFERFLLKSAPRILSQLDRDPDSPTYGCFDRDFWHYKMRDFASIVLQQGMVVLQSLYLSEGTVYSGRNELCGWVDAAIGFWASQQLSSGGFNEYYPYEDGFPPTAFSLHAVALVFQARGFPAPERPVQSAIQNAVDRLLRAPEQGAANQEATALAALALSCRIPGIEVDKRRLDSRLDSFFASQSAEGWFPEYGGADIGYLSVTLEALFDYFELSSDARAEAAMERALSFISTMISVSGQTPVMTNSRNTDYLALYGLIRMAEKNALARGVVAKLTNLADSSSHFLNATDDRYLCHYLYRSCFRGLTYLSALAADRALLPCEAGADIYYPEAGLHILHIPGKRSIYTAARKGGVVYLYIPEGLLFADFGWRQRLGKQKIALTHWQRPENSCRFVRSDGDRLVEAVGVVSAHEWVKSTPLRHFALRCASLFLGSKIIAGLKQIMIFAAADTGISYLRTVRISAGEISILDVFSGKGVDSFDPSPAPPYSLRHVASAANFSAEELTPQKSVTRDSQRTRQALTIRSTFVFPESAK